MCDLAGEWVPTRQDEWYNNNPGKHRLRARVPYTKVTYDTDGKGNGWVGELNVNIEVSSIAPGKYTASCRFGLWYAGDGNLTILDDGVLQVRYPSNGIVEYWQRVDGQGATNLAKAQSKWKAAEKVRGKASERALTLALRACLEVANEEYVWHWALAVNDEVYEVAGWMAIMGPRGIVASNMTYVAPYNTALEQFHGYLPLESKTRKSDVEICQFIEDWVNTHPTYKTLGPNCQTFADDLYTFCTGHNLQFPKSVDFIGLDSGAGPERHPRTVWNNPVHEPAEADCQQGDVDASLADRAQVFVSQSVSAVRSRMDGLTHSSAEPIVSQPDTFVDADAANTSQESTTEHGSHGPVSQRALERLLWAALGICVLLWAVLACPSCSDLLWSFAVLGCSKLLWSGVGCSDIEATVEHLLAGNHATSKSSTSDAATPAGLTMRSPRQEGRSKLVDSNRVE